MSPSLQRSRAWIRIALGLACGLALTGAWALALPAASAASPLAAADIVQRMVAMNAERTADLRAYTAVYSYHLEYHGLGSDIADMRVKVAYQKPGPKRFTIVSESGSGMLRHHVLEPLLRRERQEAQFENRDGSALVPENYDFTVVDFPRAGLQPSYVLAVTPRADSQRFLFRGKIWVNPVDFGLERVEGESVKSPSWWVDQFDFHYDSRKVGDFWLPASNHCVSHIRLFGHAVLDITYRDFKLTSTQPVSFLAAAGPPGRPLLR